MKPTQWALIKDQEVAVKPGGNMMMWELCYHNLRLCMQDLEAARGLIHLFMTVETNSPNWNPHAAILGFQEKFQRFMDGKYP